jgi:hypothetical protein
MDQWWFPLAIGVLATLTVYMFVSRKHLLVYVERYKSLPEKRWILRRDPDPEVERWRRLRLVVTGVLIVLLVVQLVTFIT